MTDGSAMWEQVMQAPGPTADAALDPFLAMTRDHVFGEVWSRPGLSVRDRRLVSLTCTALAAAPQALAVHVDAALRSGDLSADEVDEWIVHLAHYAGWPVAATVYSATRPAVNEHRGAR